MARQRRKDAIEGAVNLVGDAADPSVSAEHGLELGDDDHVEVRAIPLSQHAGIEEEELGEEEVFVEVAGHLGQEVALVYKAAETLHDLAEVVTPRRVLLASLFMLVLIATGGWVWYDLVPRDAVTLEVVYLQGGPGQVVLAELHNKGSRDITDIIVEIDLLDADGSTLNSTQFEMSRLAAHHSVAGNDLEVLVEGVSGWATYDVQVSLLYTDARDDRQSESWAHHVGDWQTERFNERADRSVWLW